MMSTEGRQAQKPTCEKRSFGKILQVIDFKLLIDESMFAWATV